VIRHGLAGTRLEDEKKDFVRPLTKRGKKELKEFAKNFEASFDEIVSSPLTRAVETAEIIQSYCGLNEKITISELLKPDSSFEKLILFLNRLKGDKIAIVGHEPFLSEFSSFCLTKKRKGFIKLKKGGVLLLEVGKTIKPGQCTLSWLYKP
jgi:phosphohistidine phosphatase